MSMTVRRPHLALCLAGAALVAACSQSPSGDPAATAPPPAATADAAPEAPQTRFIRAVPASLPDCRPAVIALEWDTSALSPAPSTVRVHIATRDSDRLFASGGARGRAETGRWALPGSTFILRSGTSGEELERVTVDGPKCGR